jgi:osmotically-inducible protein OsmY
MKTTRIHMASIAAVAALAAVPAAGSAKSGDGRVQRAGSCSGNSNWKLKAKPDDSRLETEFEVDQNRNGVTWNVTIKRNGRTAFTGTRTTRAPSGSFSVTRRLGNAAGKDRITAVAERGGETCSASLTI